MASLGVTPLQGLCRASEPWAVASDNLHAHIGLRNARHPQMGVERDPRCWPETTQETGRCCQKTTQETSATSGDVGYAEDSGVAGSARIRRSGVQRCARPRPHKRYIYGKTPFRMA